MPAPRAVAHWVGPLRGAAGMSPPSSTRGHKYGHVWSDAASSPAALRSLRRTARYASVTRLAGEALRRSKRTRTYGRMY